MNKIKCHFPTYLARSCSPPPVVPHASVLHAEDVNGDGATLSHGELVVYVCDPGYNASTPPIGDYLRACMGGGRLNGTTLFCERRSSRFYFQFELTSLFILSIHV